MIRLVISEPTPSPNKMNRGRVPHFVTMKALRKRWRDLVWAAVIDARTAGQIVEPPTGRRRVTIERHSSGALDVDNLYGSLKVLLDELRDFELIKNDDQKNIELAARNVKSKRKDAKTVVLLEDIPP